VKPLVCKLGCAYLEQIHDQLVTKLWPESEPVEAGEPRNVGLLDSAVNRPFQTAFFREIYPTILEKSAALFHSIVANHAFRNGNKRTAVIAIDHFLLANGYLLLSTNSRMYDLAESTAQYRE
jgi:death-on-curing protein